MKQPWCVCVKGFSVFFSFLSIILLGAAWSVALLIFFFFFGLAELENNNVNSA